MAGRDRRLFRYYAFTVSQDRIKFLTDWVDPKSEFDGSFQIGTAMNGYTVQYGFTNLQDRTKFVSEQIPEGADVKLYSQEVPKLGQTPRKWFFISTTAVLKPESTVEIYMLRVARTKEELGK